MIQRDAQIGGETVEEEVKEPEVGRSSRDSDKFPE